MKIEPIQEVVDSDIGNNPDRHPAILNNIEIIDDHAVWWLTTDNGEIVDITTHLSDPLLFIFMEQRKWQHSVPDETMIACFNTDYQFEVEWRMDGDNVIDIHMFYQRYLTDDDIKETSRHYPKSVKDELINCLYGDDGKLKPAVPPAPRRA